MIREYLLNQVAHEYPTGYRLARASAGGSETPVLDAEQQAHSRKSVEFRAFGQYKVVQSNAAPNSATRPIAPPG